MHDRGAESGLGRCFGYDAIEADTIKLAQLAEKIRGGLAQIIRCAEPP